VRYVFGAGGTAGHVFMALGIAKHLGGERLLITDSRGAQHLKPSLTEFDKIIVIPGPTGIRNTFRSISLIWKDMRGVYIGCGASTSLLVGIVGFLRKMKMYLYQGDQIMGRANKVMQYLVANSFVSTKNLHMRKRKVVGVVSRYENVDTKMYLGDKFKILIMGSSTGSRFFDTLMYKIFQNLDCKSEISVVQQSKSADLDLKYTELGLEFVLKEFIDIYYEMPKCHLVFCRAGWSTVADILTFRRAAILIPWSGALDNHQFYNAKAVGADSRWVFQETDSPEEIAKFISYLIKDTYSKNENEVNHGEIYIRSRYADGPFIGGGERIARSIC